MLKKISSLTGAGYYGYGRSSSPISSHDRSMDMERLRRRSRSNPSESSAKEGSHREAEGLRNTMEMLAAENKHLKKLIEDRDARASSLHTADEREGGMEVLRSENNELKQEVTRLQRELQSKEEILESMQREGALLSSEVVEGLKKKVASLEAQLAFECRNHSKELNEKEARVAELEMQLLDAQQQASKQPAEDVFEEPPQSAQDLNLQQVSAAGPSVFVQSCRGECEANRGSEETASCAGRRVDSVSQCATPAAAAFLRLLYVSPKPKRGSLALGVRFLRRDILEMQLAEAESKRVEAEEALSVHRALAEGDGDALPMLEKLRREMQEKNAALESMSQQLLEISAERDEIEQEFQKLREAPSAPETPRSKGSRRGGLFGRSKTVALERDALALQVQQLEEQLQTLNEKRVELERTKVKMEGQLAEAAQEVRAAKGEQASLKDKLQEREAALQALRAAKADMDMPLEKFQAVSLPVPRGPHDADFDAKAELVLKEGVIRTLSSRLAYLQFALKEVTAEKQQLLAQPATIALQRHLEEVKKDLVEAKAKYREAAAQCTQLKAKVKSQTEEIAEAESDRRALKAALEESQLRLSTTADKYKEQNDRYRDIVSDSLAKVEELQDEVSRERNGKILVGKVYRQEMLELRKAAVQRGAIRGDPLRPLSVQRPQAEGALRQSHVEQSLPEKLPTLPPPVSAAPLSPALPALVTAGCRSAVPTGTEWPRAGGHPCLFSGGMAVAVNKSQNNGEFATIPACLSLGLTPRAQTDGRPSPRFVPFAGPPAYSLQMPSGAAITRDQLLAAGALAERKPWRARVSQQPLQQLAGECPASLPNKHSPANLGLGAVALGKMSDSVPRDGSHGTGSDGVGAPAPAAAMSKDTLRSPLVGATRVEEATVLPNLQTFESQKEVAFFSGADLGSCGYRQLLEGTLGDERDSVDLS
ncbi:MAR-binding filament-like protein 1-1 [Cyclospora cayetanensis]|uniref:MAR-binding filament-like protein 1-1 n=1 Tax=Cyclospora cayetanensis TaxID=88456 RepID=A0A6P6S3V8_9EIME|nr:MAR-binding filament-like protein 1-1 [Cyclospora cayetanensis]